MLINGDGVWHIAVTLQVFYAAAAAAAAAIMSKSYSRNTVYVRKLASIHSSILRDKSPSLL